LDAIQLKTRLAELLAEHKVPGAALGILKDGEITEVAAGVLNLNTGVEATTDTLWQIGSMTKAWTATAVMQLVDDGLLDLDAPLKTYLPGFKVADPDVSAKVTMRHLLSHTSGIDGDNFEDFGRGDDCLERYVESCAKSKQSHPLGATMSYCNTGYSIAGRLIEVLTGKVWDEAMRERLFTPLGLTHTCTLPEEALLYRTAVGHIPPKPGEPVQVAPVWMLPRICGPMGLINSTVRDVLTWSRLFLEDGKTVDGKQLVSAQSIKEMQTPVIEIPDPHTLGSHWGTGLILFDWGGRRLVGHDGDTIGQHARLRILPDANLTITLIMNGGDTSKVFRALYSELLQEFAGITVPPLPEAPKTPPKLDLSKYAGTYERLAVRYELIEKDGHLAGTVTLSGPLAKLLPDPVIKLTLTPVDAGTFLVHTEGEETPSVAVFYDFDKGAPRYLHNGARANPRR
jgi:CubicO group peptidase (beta-lactamase class C family)